MKYTAKRARGEEYSSQFRIAVCREGSKTLFLFKGRKSKIDTLLSPKTELNDKGKTITQNV